MRPATRDIECIQRVASFDRIERSCTECDQSRQCGIYRNRNPSEIFDREDVHCTFEPIAAEVARRRGRGPGEFRLTMIAGFTIETPLIARLPMLRAGHDRNRYLPRLTVS